MKLPVKTATIAGVYFLPSAIAVARKHRNGSAVFMLNLLAGWTVIGWVICLVWAVIRDPSSY
jgi:hypothetical protein